MTYLLINLCICSKYLFDFLSLYKNGYKNTLKSETKEKKNAMQNE